MEDTLAPSPRRRWVELVVLFGVGPWVVSLGPRWLVLPVIIAGGAICLVALLRDPTFRRGTLTGLTTARLGLRGVLLRALAVWAGLLVFAVLTQGLSALFRLPRTRPFLWVTVMLLYPLLSVYPQELMYRTFFFHRYAGLFKRPAALLAANALLFGWSHIIVHNRVAMLLATVGGALLAITYQRWRSTVLVSVEHALYGNFIFSVGIGGMFVNGVRLLSHWIK
jgi:hypothetical protein